MPEESLVQLGALGIILLFTIKELFAYLKTRKDGSSEGGVNGAILNELQKMNDNHLRSLEKAINDGNEKVVTAINDGNLRQIELLGEIKGSLK